jgi:lysophospholipase L1-like esterase
MKRIGIIIMALLLVVGTVCADGIGHVVILGDSNTWIGGDDCTQPRGWNKWFCETAAPTSCRSYARSGATWTHTEATTYDTEEYSEVLSDNNVIYNQINRLKKAYEAGEQPLPDLIIIMAGTNDAWFRWSKVKEERGERREERGAQTLEGAVRSDCTMLRELFPECRLLLLTPMQTTKTSLGNIRRTGDIIEACGKKLGAEVLRLDREGCVKRKQELKKRTLTTDGVHTNEAGARCIGRLVAERVMNNK